MSKNNGNGSQAPDAPIPPEADAFDDRFNRMGTPDESYDDPDEWGGYAAEAIFDNEDDDNPRHKLSIKELIAHAPTLRVIRFQNEDPREEQLRSLVQSPMFKGVEYLDLRRNFREPGDEEMARIIASGGAAGLRFLNLDNCYWAGDATLRAIGSGAMPRLEALALGSNGITDEGLAALADESKTPALKRVQGMFLDKISDDGVDELAQRRPSLSIDISG